MGGAVVAQYRAFHLQSLVRFFPICEPPELASSAQVCWRKVDSILVEKVNMQIFLRWESAARAWLSTVAFIMQPWPPASYQGSSALANVHGGEEL